MESKRMKWMGQEQRNAYKNSVEELQEKRLLRNSYLGGRIILKYLLEKNNVKL
jgi:hypothetical protein